MKTFEVIANAVHQQTKLMITLDHLEAIDLESALIKAGSILLVPAVLSDVEIYSIQETTYED